MKLLHISVAILSLLLVFVSIVHASDTHGSETLSQAEEDRILDDLDGVLNAATLHGVTQPAAAPVAKKPEVYHALELQNGEVISNAREQDAK